MKFIITVDTEADNQWEKDSPITAKNISYLPRFQDLCKKYNFPPTYLVTYEVAQNKNIINQLKYWQDSKEAEIGAHLHPWTTPPIKNENNEHIYPHELKTEDLKKKLEVLTNAIQENFKKKPTSYRAGRWGFDYRQASMLNDLGYIVDCSITPKVNWKKSLGKGDGKGGPDFRNQSVKPYYFENGLLEVPMTILFTGIFNKEDGLLKEKFLYMDDGLIKKIINRLFFRQKWLRVFPNSSEKDWKKIYKSAKKINSK